MFKSEKPKSMVEKTGPDWPVQPVAPGTGQGNRSKIKLTRLDSQIRKNQ